jgi:hypothetical protein
VRLEGLGQLKNTMKETEGLLKLFIYLFAVICIGKAKIIMQVSKLLWRMNISDLISLPTTPYSAPRESR